MSLARIAGGRYVVDQAAYRGPLANVLAGRGDDARTTQIKCRTKKRAIANIVDCQSVNRNARVVKPDSHRMALAIMRLTGGLGLGVEPTETAMDVWKRKYLLGGLTGKKLHIPLAHDGDIFHVANVLHELSTKIHRISVSNRSKISKLSAAMSAITQAQIRFRDRLREIKDQTE